MPLNLMTPLLLSIVGAASAAPVSFSSPGDPVSVSFAFFGCNRVEKDEVEAGKVTNPSTANRPELLANFRDIASVTPRPAFTVAGGDIVMNYVDDQGQALRRQLDAWSKVVGKPKPSVIAVAGNHELNRKVDKLKLGNPPTDPIWSQWVKRNGLVPVSNGPNPKLDKWDNLIDDQRSLSFSFNKNGVHFVLLNTDTRVSRVDPATGQPFIGWIPLAWVSNDIRRAQADPGVKTIIVMGHRNLIDPAQVKGDAPIAKPAADALVSVFASAPKVKLYVCAHVHAYDVRKIEGTSAVQLVCGNGGSKLEKDWSPDGGPFFGFSIVNVYRSGRVGWQSYQRPVPEKEDVNGRTPAAVAVPQPWRFGE